MTVLGEGRFSYEVSGEDWGNLPDGWTYKEATAVAVDAKDNVYVFNRGTEPIAVFDTDGNFRRMGRFSCHFRNSAGSTFRLSDPRIRPRESRGGTRIACDARTNRRPHTIEICRLAKSAITTSILLVASDPRYAKA